MEILKLCCDSPTVLRNIEAATSLCRALHESGNINSAWAIAPSLAECLGELKDRLDYRASRCVVNRGIYQIAQRRSQWGCMDERPRLPVNRMFKGLTFVDFYPTRPGPDPLVSNAPTLRSLP